MNESHYLFDVIIFLAATVIVVPLFERLRASPLVGYLLAGALIGPNGLGIMSDPDGVWVLAEMGVVMLLFTIGLELTMQRFRLLGARAFGVGGGQILVTGVVIGAIAVSVGQDLSAAIVIGGALALSSTAVVLQLMIERHEMATRFGRMALAILLLQDLAVGPLLVLIPMLGSEGNLGSALGLAGAKAVAVLATILVVGRLVLRPLFQVVEKAQAPELSTAAILLVIIGTGALSHWAGLSMALGAFAAGMVLAETEYRHKVMTDIQPFRGLMLGLFFLAVGMFIDVRLILDRPELMLGMIVTLMIGKAVILFAAARLGGMTWVDSGRIGLLLAQGGGFAFVLLSVGLEEGVVAPPVVQALMLVVAVTMALTPPLAAVGGWLAHRLEPAAAPGLDALEAETGTLESHVVLAGFGRVGTSVARRLTREGVRYVALENDLRLVIDGVARGYAVYHGDALRPEVLEAAGIGHCQAVVVSLGEARGARGLVAFLRYLFPELRIVARARDEAHGRDLIRAGANDIVVEVLEAGDRLAGAIVVPVGDDDPLVP